MADSAPVSDILKYVLVRPPRIEASRAASARGLLLIPSEEIALLLRARDEIPLRGKIKWIQERLNASEIKKTIILAREFRQALRTSLYDDSLTEKSWAEMRANFQPLDDIESIIQFHVDVYFLSIAVDDYESAAILCEDIKSCHCLLVLQKLEYGDESLDLNKLLDPLVILPLPEMQEASESEVSDDGGDKEYFIALIMLQIANDTINLLRSNGGLKVSQYEAVEKNESVQAQDEQAAIFSIGTTDKKFVIAASWESAFPGSVGDFLKVFFHIVDVNDVDIIQLSNEISAEIQARIKFAFFSLGSKQIIYFLKEIGKISEGYRSGRNRNFEDYAETITRAVSVAGEVQQQKLSLGQPSKIRPIGIADLKVVRQQLQKYALGEIAHVENVLKGERRVRRHHRAEKVEQTFSFEEEETTTKEKDLQTTERFELSQEVEKVFSEKQKTEASLKVSGTYGVVTIAANAGMSNEQSIEESAKTARSYVRETISKASERIENRTKKTTTVATIFETTEDNEHEFSATTDTVVGIYRWVEKHYICQTFNYGARLMFELSIPEPAAFYLYAQDNRPDGQTELRPPEPISFSAADVTEYTYLLLASRYGASVSAPPSALMTAQIAAIQGASDTDSNSSKITIGESWEMIAASPIASCRKINVAAAGFRVLISPHLWKSEDRYWSAGSFYPGVRGEFSVGFNGVYVEHFSVSVNLLLSRTPEAYASWQLATYNAIVEAYQSRKSDYERKIAAIQARRPTATARTDVEYREIERNELKRAAIHLVTGQDLLGFNAISHSPGNAPVMDPDEAIAEGKFVRLIENGFEWAEMVYEFFPYFWGGKSVWVDSFASSDQDPVFQRFLRAGFGRVVVPVRRGAERGLIYYLETGKIWEGNNPPVINDPVYLALIQELEKVNEEEAASAVPEGAPWKQTIPTNLVCLDGKLLPNWEIKVEDGELGYAPSKRTCNGIPYNEAQWPADFKAVVRALADLGYNVGVPANNVTYLNSPAGIRIVRAFQMHANKLGISAQLGKALSLDGSVGPCTLRALTVAVAMLRAGQWSRPV